MTNKKVSLTRGASDQISNRENLIRLFNETPIPTDELLINLGLYTRSSYLASILFMDEIYRKTLKVPGVIMEFGVWWGANLALFQSLRGVYEPYNYTRRVIGFDTFSGYPDRMKSEDKNSKYLFEGNYSVSENYEKYLEEVLEFHDRENVMPQKKKYEIIKGDIVDTLPSYLNDNPQTIISLAYFDMGLYEPTKLALESIKPYLTKGSILVMDELNFPDMPGETIALKEVFGLDKFRIERS
ncbi:MAG: TylF/MycF/NovP-related O-methyltransferase, partial [Crocinitomicaceae bacterium]